LLPFLTLMLLSIRSFLVVMVIGPMIGFSSIAAASVPPPVTPPAGHPRLLLRPDDLATVRASQDDPALAASWAELRRRAYLPDDYTPEPRYDLSVLHAAEATAFLAMVDGDQAGKRRAIELAFTLLGTNGPDRKASYFALRAMGRCLFAVAEVYDWCHDAATQEERLRLCALMREHATVMEIKFPPTTPNALAGHSSEDQLMRDQLAIAIATFDEDPEIYELVAGRFYREFTSPRDFHYAGHFHHQGNSYGFGRFGADMGGALLLTKMDAPEPWSLSAMSQVPYYYLYLRRPDGGLIKEGDDYLGDSRPSGSY
jgi:heparin/heparan-sulfate lyase